jgi:hypothetical protein
MPPGEDLGLWAGKVQLQKRDQPGYNQAPAISSARTPGSSSPERLLRCRRSKQYDMDAVGILMCFIATSRTPCSGIGSAEVGRAVNDGERPEIEEWDEAEEYSPELTPSLPRAAAEGGGAPVRAGQEVLVRDPYLLRGLPWRPSMPSWLP